ncbi:MAG: exonuclease domain-containing protein [Planctomycetaceae bacterium]
MSAGLGNERLVFVDLETGGLEPSRPILQIAAVAVTSTLREVEVFEAKLSFDEADASPESLRKNHYSRARWEREGREPRKVAGEFSSFLRRHASVDHPTRDGRVIQVAQIVAHNAAFDGAFLEAWYDRHGMFLPASRRVLCTMQRAIWLFHEDKSLTPPTDYKLATLCEYFGVRLKAHEAHDALIDVRATVELYRQMIGWSQRQSVAA